MNSDSPWYGLFQLMPTPFPYCGESTAAWIHDPVDTWSSLIYFAVSLWMYQKSKPLGEHPLKRMYLIPIIIGIGSILFHTSFTYIFLMADFFGIFTLNFFCMELNRFRLKGKNERHVFLKALVFSLIWTPSMILTWNLRISSGLTMVPPILLSLWLELRCYKYEKNTLYLNFWIAGMMIVAGYILMLMEGKPWHIGCKGTFFELHTWWHVMSAISMIFIFKFYRQFSDQKGQKLS